MEKLKIVIQDGVFLYPGLLGLELQDKLVQDVRAAAAQAPMFTPIMPRTGKPFSVKMTNLGSFGWVSDRAGGYRYQSTHPASGKPWPAIFPELLSLWSDVSGYGAPPDACIVNFYSTVAKMGLHQDRDEEELSAPVVSISLGDAALFRIGGVERGGKTTSCKLASGDVLVFGGPSRLAYHGIDRVYPGTSTLLKDGGRINLTLRRVMKFTPQATKVHN